MLRILKVCCSWNYLHLQNRKGNDKSHEILRKLVKYILKISLEHYSDLNILRIQVYS